MNTELNLTHKPFAALTLDELYDLLWLRDVVFVVGQGITAESEVDGEASDPRNPPVEAIVLLDEARKTAPDARLVRWTVEHEPQPDDDDDQEALDWAGFAAVADFLSREIVFGGPDA